MALIRSTAYALGSIVELRGPRGSVLAATAPDGLEVRIPAPSGRARLWLAQPGRWIYTWGSERVELHVEPAAPADEQPSVPRMIEAS